MAGTFDVDDVIPNFDPAGALAALTPALTGVSAARIRNARPSPQFFSATTAHAAADAEPNDRLGRLPPNKERRETNART